MRKHVRSDNSTTFIKKACAIVFCIFTFCYLYFYQADMMYVWQYALSGGKTCYDKTVGAVVATAVLYLLHSGVCCITKPGRRSYALTFFPPLLILAIMTCHVPNGGQWVVPGSAKWAFVSFASLYIIFVLISRNKGDARRKKMAQGMFIRDFWINILTLFALFMFTGLTGNGKDTVHYRAKIEANMLRGDYDRAVMIGAKSEAADSSLTMLRIYALARKRQLGDRLFQYPVTGGAEAMLPNNKNVKTFFYSEDEIVRFANTKKGSSYKDYRLCKHLLDKDLDSFVKELAKYYETSSDTLPKHYAEALVLYTHIRTNRIISYTNEVMETDYADMQKQARDFTSEAEKETFIKDNYRNTYWHYYLYGK